MVFIIIFDKCHTLLYQPVSILEHFLDKQVLAFQLFLRFQHFLLNHPQRNIRLLGDDILLRNLQKYLNLVLFFDVPLKCKDLLNVEKLFGLIILIEL